MKVVLRTCLGVLALLQVAPAQAALRFYVAPEDTAATLARTLMSGGQFFVYASGEIEDGDTDRFVAFLADHKVDDALVILDSPGGSLMESLKLGELIRKKRFDTSVGALADGKPAVCASACAYAFAGGVYRYLDSKSGKLGIHQFSSTAGTTGRIGDIQLLSGAVVEYLEEMGVDGRAFSLAATASPEEIVWVTPENALKLRIANNGTLPTTAEIITADMTPALRLHQIGARSDIRVLLVCAPKGVVVQAGIAAAPEDVGMNEEISKRSYLEFDGVESLVEGAGRVKAEDNILWLVRGMPLAIAMKFGRATQLGVWTEGGGAVRFGGYVSLTEVRDPINRYLDDCRGYESKQAK